MVITKINVLATLTSMTIGEIIYMDASLSTVRGTATKLKKQEGRRYTVNQTLKGIRVKRYE